MYWKMADGSCPLYVACKAAIHGLTWGHAREFGAAGIRVNTVLPGWVDDRAAARSLGRRRRRGRD